MFPEPSNRECHHSVMPAEQADALEEVSLIRKVLAASVVAMVLSGVPSQLVAQERASQPTKQAAVLEWFSAIWNDLATWLTDGAASSMAADLDGSCWVDPNGGCPNGG